MSGPAFIFYLKSGIHISDANNKESSAVSEVGLHFLSMSRLGDTRHKLVKSVLLATLQ